MHPAFSTASIGAGLTAVTLPTSPSAGLRISARSIASSAPLMPIARAPSPTIAATRFLLMRPVSTATTMSRLGASVTRSPRTNWGLTPCFAIQSLIILPPP